MKWFMRTWVLVALIASAMTASAETTPDKQTLVDTYLAVWSEKDADKRREQLTQVFVEHGVHQSPTTHSVGYDAIDAEIEAFQQRFPGASVTATNLLVTKDQLVFNFALVDAQGGPIVSGVDYVKLSENGSKIEKVVGFY